ncbi:MAG: RIP metalloprotease RseP [Pseudomonadota bacterium]
MDLLYTIGVLLATLAVLVAVHEYGHFWVARRCGVKVLRFSIGFGPALYTWRDKLDTEYCIAAIPLGGYVKMLDEREGEVDSDELEQAFNRKPVSKRIAVVAAGPAANFLLAIFVYWGLFLSGESGYSPIVGEVQAGSVADVAGLEPGQEIVAVDGEETPTRQALIFRLLDRIGDTGPIVFSVKYPNSDMVYESEGQLNAWLSGDEEPNLLGGLGLSFYLPETRPIAEQVIAGGAAEAAGLQKGDVLLSGDGVAMPLWRDWVDYIRARPGEPIRLEYQRGLEVLTTVMTPERTFDDRGKAFGLVGLGPKMPEMPQDMVRQFDRGPVAALGASLDRTWELTVFTLNSIKKMIQGLISPKNLSGPITIAKVASDSAKSGWEAYFAFLALLSVSLGVLNLLPIPVLDGGHLLFYFAELLAGRPVPEKVQMLGYQVGLFLVLGIMFLALYNDFSRL